MAEQLAKIAALSLLTYAFVFAGVFFISGQILPSYFGRVYAATSIWSRTLIASATFIMAANFLQGWALTRFSPALVSPVMIAAFALMLVAFTVGVTGAKPSWMIVPATLVVMGGCVWVSLLLGKS
jgi:hypothetical protein